MTLRDVLRYNKVNINVDNVNAYAVEGTPSDCVILANKEIGILNWIEYRDLKEGAKAFKQIHDGTCVAPKIILLP